MPTISPPLTPRGGPNPRRPVPIRAAAPWLMMSIAVIAVLALGLLTFPSSPGAVSASIQRDHRPADGVIGRSPTTAFRPTPPVALPAAMALVGSEPQMWVVPLGSWTGVLHRPTAHSAVRWWITGRRLGAPCGSVSTGHVRSATGGEGLSALDRLEQGDLILLTGADGTIHRYRVTQRRQSSPVESALSMLADSGSSVLLISWAGRSAAAGANDTHLLITAGELAG